jgi:hypothetical protein
MFGDTHMKHGRRLSFPGALGLAALLALLSAGPTAAALFLLLDPDSGPPGTEVTGQTGGEGAFATLVDPLPAYLVAAAAADSVTNPDDPNLVEIGELVVDASGNGEILFRVPQIEPGDYVVMVFCPSCAPFSAGRAMAPVADFRVTPSTPATDTAPAAPDGWFLFVLVGGVLLLVGVTLMAFRLRLLR